MKCSQCGTLNPEGTLFCNICFTPLEIEKNNQVHMQIGNGKSNNESRPKLVIIENTQPTGQIIKLPMPPYNSSILIGRTDLKSGVVVDIDVNIFGGFDKGVSRKHAKISHSNDNFFIEDWESNLGTYVNKEKIAKGVEKLIKNGDEIRFANLISRFEIC